MSTSFGAWDSKDLKLENRELEGGNSSPSRFLPNMQDLIVKLTNSVRLSMRPLPTETGDGSYLGGPKHESALQDLSSLDSQDLMTIKDIATCMTRSGPVDDKKYYMERVIKVSAALPLDLLL